MPARLVLPQGRYAALLVSLHGTGLYERFDAAKESPENVERVQNYLIQERAFQQELLASLRADLHYQPSATEEAVTRNRRLLQIWDALSLTLSVFSPREGVDQIWPGNGVIYSQRLRALRTKSRLSKIVGTPAYQFMTIRNWSTTTTLLSLMQLNDKKSTRSPDESF